MLAVFKISSALEFCYVYMWNLEQGAGVEGEWDAQHSNFLVLKMHVFHYCRKCSIIICLFVCLVINSLYRTCHSFSPFERMTYVRPPHSILHVFKPFLCILLSFVLPSGNVLIIYAVEGSGNAFSKELESKHTRLWEPHPV